MTTAVRAHLDQSSISQKSPEFCSYGAPYVAMIADGKARVFQACCNHWNCPKCHSKLAAMVRQRMVYGAEKLWSEQVALYFWTFTCRGRDLDLETADDHYYEWTNRALARLRAAAKREGRPWIYVQITERQRRGAAHSHFVHTYRPGDAFSIGKHKGHEEFFSLTFYKAVVAAGLGPKCQITEVGDPGAVSSYISGYLTKHGATDKFPAHWRRVRWSANWPKLPELTPDFVQLLTHRRDWDKADQQGATFIAENEGVYKVAKHHMVHVL